MVDSVGNICLSVHFNYVLSFCYYHDIIIIPKSRWSVSLSLSTETKKGVKNETNTKCKRNIVYSMDISKSKSQCNSLFGF